QAGDGFPCRAHAVPRALRARLRHIPSRHRIVALPARAGVGSEQRLEAIDVSLGGGKLDLGRADVAFGRGELRLRLTNVLDPGACRTNSPGESERMSMRRRCEISFRMGVPAR